jgi:hypothetical protein
MYNFFQNTPVLSYNSVYIKWNHTHTWYQKQSKSTCSTTTNFNNIN